MPIAYAFHQHHALNPSLVPTNEEVMKFASQYFNKDTKEFDWSGFTTAAARYGGPDLRFGKTGNTTIHRGDFSVSEMVSEVVGYIRFTYGVSSAVDESELAAIMTTVFTNLKSHKNSGFADFESASSSYNSYIYRASFSFPSSSDPNEFHCLVASIKLSASIEEESSWWGLSGSVRKDFSASIESIQLDVLKGFTAP